MSRKQLIQAVRQVVWSLYCTVTDTHTVRKLSTEQLKIILQEVQPVVKQIETSVG